MKREMDLVRGILIAGRDAEKSLNSNEIHSALGKISPAGPQWSNKQIFYHVKIMKEAGLIDANLIVHYGNTSGTCTNMHVRWEGQEFLDNVRDPSIWEQVKQKAGVASFAILQKVALDLATTLVK